MTGQGQFLRSRRARITRAAAGIRSSGRRRGPGLRREALAQLAGISVTYPTRLEQGTSANASRSAIGALARALDLDDAERTHLDDAERTHLDDAERTHLDDAERAHLDDAERTHLDDAERTHLDDAERTHLDDAERTHLDDVARPSVTARRRRPRPDRAGPGTRAILGAPTLPAVALGRRDEVLACNAAGHRRLAGHGDPAAPDRPVEVADCVPGRKHRRHPEVGELQLELELEAAVPDESGRRLLVRYARPGSPSASALALLGDGQA